MRKLLFALTAVVCLAMVGCEETPSDPTGEPIIGEWKSSNVGATFAGSSDVTIDFNSGGSMSIKIGNGSSVTGTYSVASSSSSSTIRTISMNANSVSYAGIYEINGSSMKLEVLTVPPPSGVSAPYPEGGMGSTMVNGSKTNSYITVMQKQ